MADEPSAGERQRRRRKMSNAEQPMDHARNHASDDDSDDDGVARPEGRLLEEHVKSKRTWMRLLFMILMSIAWSIAVAITSIVVVVNFFYVLFTGESNSRLTVLGHSLASYLFQIVEYMTFNTETRPFPFDEEWPAPEPEDDSEAA
jgi:hypothetical protein